MPVIVWMIVRMAVPVITVVMVMSIPVIVRMAMFVVQSLPRPRVIREDERLDRYRDRSRWQANFAEIDVIEIPEYDPVDHQDTDRHIQFVLQDMSE